MKVSINWMQHYSNVDLLPKNGVEELVVKIGAQLGAVEEVIDMTPKYKGIIVAKVVTCEKHPNADKLSICLIDDGGKVKGVKRDKQGLVQVVCGAPNVRAAMLVAWLPPGSTVPSSYGKEPFLLESREIRGQMSNGMLASAHELDISDDHNGIVELEGVKPGEDFTAVMKLDDQTIDIENKMFTHRPDCFGILGVAREVAGIQGKVFKSPEWYREFNPNKLRPGNGQLKLEVKNELTKLVPRFMALAVSGVEVKPSPLWLQSFLSRVGLKPINNIVDLSNYYMVLTGQPLHAYDYDKLPAKSLETRLSKKGDKLTLLGGKEIKFEDDSTILITSGGKPVGVGGVMGGRDTEVDDKTKNIVLECANFDMYAIRRTSMAYGLFTDAVTRFSKGQSPLQNDRVITKIAQDIKNLANGRVASKLLDVKARLKNPLPVHVRADFINERLGSKMTAAEMARLLKNVEFGVQVNGPTLVVTPPFWRTDIEIPEDIVEEVGRLTGYDNLPMKLPRRSIMPPKRNPLVDLKSHIRDTLSKAGANEALSYSFVHSNLMDKAGQDKKHAFKLSNALSPDLQFFRTTLTPSLLEKVHLNSRAGYDEFALFELDKVHYKGEWEEDEPDVPLEDNHLALVLAYDQKKQPQGAPYFQARLYLEQILGTLTHDLVPLEKFDLNKDKWGQNLVAPYDPKRSAVIVRDDQIWGVVGEFQPKTRRELKLPSYSAGFEMNLGIVQSAAGSYRPISRFPKVEQDMTLRVATELAFSDLDQSVDNAITQLLDSEKVVADRTVLDIYQPKDKRHKHVTYRFTVASYERTMKAEEVNKLLDEIAHLIATKFRIARI